MTVRQQTPERTIPTIVNPGATKGAKRLVMPRKKGSHEYLSEVHMLLTVPKADLLTD